MAPTRTTKVAIIRATLRIGTKLGNFGTSLLLKVLRLIDLYISLIDLSLSADNNRHQNVPHNPGPRAHLSIFRVDDIRAFIPGVYKYADQYNDRIRIDMFELNRLPNQLALVDNYIIGVSINGGVYPMWNRRGDRVVVDTLSGGNVVMTPELHERYDRYYTPFQEHPRWEEFRRRWGNEH